MSPPLNATNLLDISHALEAVNVTRLERTNLGAQETDKLGQILTVLNGKIGNLNDSIEQLQTTLNQKGILGVESGSYTGNGQSTVTISFTHPIKFMFVQGKSINGGDYCSIICNTFDKFTVLYGYTGRMWSSLFDMSFPNNKAVVLAEFNATGERYQYYGIVDLST